MKSLFFSFGLLLSAASVTGRHVLHEKRDQPHKRWVQLDRVHSDAKLPMRIALKQSSLENGYDHLMDVSDPASPNYGKHWTSEQVIEAFQPAPETVDTVRDWLVDSGIDIGRITHSDNKQWFAFEATTSEAEELLKTEYHEFEDSMSGAKLPGCWGYHLPEHVSEHVDFVKPGITLVSSNRDVGDQDLKLKSKRGETVNFGDRVHSGPFPKFAAPSFPMSQNHSDLSTCDVAITPQCVAALYQIPEPTTRAVNPSNIMGIYESEAQYWNQQDLNLFFRNFTPYIPQGTNPGCVSIDGAYCETKNLTEAGGEVELDLQLSYPIVWPQKIKIYQEDDPVYELDPQQTYNWGFNHFLDAIDGSYCTYSAYGETGDDPNLDPHYPDPAPGGYKGQTQCGVYKPTNVFSISYGGQEADLPFAYQARQCNEWMKLGLQGVSVLFASGDAGVGNYPAPYGDDGPTGCLGPKGNIFNPTWPNNCPFLTSVGATKVYPGKTVFEPESAVYDPAGHPYHVNYSSGGGFSNIYPIPNYQKAAVANFFALHNPPYPSYSALTNDTSTVGTLGKNGGIYNRIGRGHPDVSANGDNIAVYVGGKFSLSGGTSAAAPIFGSVINRLVEERLKIGKGPLGFLNPALYANPYVLNDITNGTNPGCGTVGFSAVQGWDPVTGLGTPNYPRMLALFLGLP